MPKERSIIEMIWKNFRNSLRPRQTKGDLIGKDSFGNKYFEIPADPSIGKRKSSRFFEPSIKEKYDQETPAEWEAWLRGRRKDPPTEEEVLQNQAIADMKKINAAELDRLHHPEKSLDPEPEKIKSFPGYKEYEIMPGSSIDPYEKEKEKK